MGHGLCKSKPLKTESLYPGWRRYFPQTSPNGHWTTGWQERHVEKLQCFGFPRRRCRALSANDGSRLENHLTSGDTYPSLTQIHNDSYLITSLLVCFLLIIIHTFSHMFPKVPLPLCQALFQAGPFLSNALIYMLEAYSTNHKACQLWVLGLSVLLSNGCVRHIC